MISLLPVLCQDALNDCQDYHKDCKHNRHGGRQAHLPVDRAGLINIVHNGVGGVVRPAARHNHGLHQHAEGADGDGDKHEHAQGLQLRQSDILKSLPGAGVVYLRRLVEGGTDVLQASQENNHLIPHALPHAHDCDGRKRLFGAVDERLCFYAEGGEDGVNDSLALTYSDVGIGLAKGSDVALASSDFILMNSDLIDILDIIEVSKLIRKNIAFNLLWAFIYNTLFIPLAAGALALVGVMLTPMYASMLMALSSVTVCLNSLTLLIKKRNHKEKATIRKSI